MGVTTSILSDADIQSKATLAEALIKKAVPGYAVIVTAGSDEGATNEDKDALTFLRSACIAQVCALLCPGMAQRVKVMQQDETLYSFKIQATNWDRKKREFEGLVREYICIATGQEDVIISPVGVVFNDRLEV
jgi:hypothetical protein